MTPPAEDVSADRRDFLLGEIVALWRREFVREDIGPDDDFFELGGDSLLALDLISLLEEQCSIAVPSSALLEARTPRSLAAHLAAHLSSVPGADSGVGDEGAPPPPYLVRLAPCDSAARSPVICFHAIDGGVFFYGPWASSLGLQDREVHAFESPLLHGLEVPETTLEALAARYLSEIASSHPSGPLFLLGYSFGALLAYEVARQAREAGRLVEGLVMVDMFNPARVRQKSTAERLRDAWRDSPAPSAHRRAVKTIGKASTLARSLAKNLAGALSERLPGARPALRRRKTSRHRHFGMAREYRPRPTDARTLLVLTHEPWDKFAYEDEKRGWAPCLGGEVEVGFLKGNHLEAFQGENLPTLVERTRRFLR